MEANIGFAVIATNGIFDHRDWFIAVCPDNKKVARQLRCKRSPSIDGVYEIKMNQRDVKDFNRVKDQFKMAESCDFGVVYEYIQKPLKESVTKYKIQSYEDKLEMLKKWYHKKPTDLVNIQMSDTRKKLNDLKMRLLQA